MSKKIFVGGLAFSTNEDELRNLFEPFGQIETVQIVTDRYTQKSRGFGFVEMTSDDEAAKAIESLNGTELAGRALTVNEARPPQRREGGGGGGRGGGFGGGRGGGFGGGGGRGGPRRGGGGGGGRW